MKISVLIPSLNAGKYIRTCLESVQEQTLKDIEIICIDAGSEDETLKIINDSAQIDNRIKVINSDRRSYGYQMNLGLNTAQGDYIGIVEPDDYIDNMMYEKLYQYVIDYNLDFIKSDFFMVQTSMCTRKYVYDMHKIKTGIIFDKCENMNKLSGSQAIWTGLYRKEFLNNNHIRFLESKGASFQDTSFWFKVAISAEKGYFIDKAYYYYRIDNESSSVKAMDKVFCICDEIAECEEFLHRKSEADRHFFHQWFSKFVWTCYVWNLNRLDDEGKSLFLPRFSDDIAHKYKLLEYGEALNDNQKDSILAISNYPDICLDFFLRKYQLVETIKDLDLYRGVYIYGTGSWGKSVSENINLRSKSKIVWIVTKVKSPNETSIYNDSLDLSFPIIIASANNYVRMNMYVNTINRGFTRVFVAENT